MARGPQRRGAQCGCIGLRPALDPTKMPGLTTDGAAAMVGNTIDLSRSFWKHSKRKVLW